MGQGDRLPTDFCAGCPARGSFLDTPSGDTAKVEVDGPREVDNSITHSYDPYKAFGVSVQFIDGMQGQTKEVRTTYMFRPEKEDEVRTKAQIKKAAQTAKDHLIERVEACTSAGTKSDGKRYCPAFNTEIMRRLLNAEIK